MNALQEGWFSEVGYWPGTSISLKVDKILYNKKSDYQDVLVIETKTHGKALVLDGAIQFTEKDEFSYQEGIAFLPLCSHPNPEKVLIIGGAGGVALEAAKHPDVKSITQVEIDSCVLEAAREYLPYKTVGLDNPKVKLHVGDGFEYMKNHANEFDVIITDSSDPVGPAAALFQDSYYKLMKTVLRPGGIVCSQGGFVWIKLDEVKQTLANCKSAFPVVDYCFASVPTYPTGQVGFVMGSLNPDTDFKEPLRIFSEKELDDMNLRYYSAEVHRAAFGLPRFVDKVLRPSED